MSKNSKVNRRIALGLAAGAAATLTAGVGTVLLTGSRSAWRQSATQRLMSFIPDQAAAKTVGTPALKEVGIAGSDSIVEAIAGDLELSLEQIAMSPSPALEAKLAGAIGRDCDRGLVVVLDGWIVPRVVARLCALAAMVSG